MRKQIQFLLWVGIGIAAFKLVKKLVHSHDEERPPIRVRSGGSLEVTTTGGDFEDLGTEWRHDHSARGPVRLLVTMVGTDCGLSYRTNRVEIYCTSSTGPLDAVTIQRQGTGGASDAYVRPPNGAPRSQPSQTRALIWPNDGSVVIDHVKVNGRTCQVIDPAIAEVIVEQKRW